MANTIDSALFAETLKSTAAEVLKNRLAPLGAFSTNFGTNPTAPRSTIIVPVASGASAVQTNPSNFETGDTTLSAISVTVNHDNKGFHVTSEQANNAVSLAQLAKVNLAALADKIMDVALAPLSAASVSYTGAASSFSATDLQDGWAAIGKSDIKNVILSSEFFARFLPTSRESFVPGDGAYGFNGFYQNTRWSGSTAGVFCGPSAVAIAAGQPITSNGMIASDVVTVPGLGLAVQYNVWESVATRQLWASYDVVLGAAAGNLDAAALIATS